MPKRLLTIEEVAGILGIQKRTIYNQIHSGSSKKFPIKPKRVGRLIRFRSEDVEKYIAS